MHDFSGFQANMAELDEWSGGFEAGFFPEFPDRGVHPRFVLLHEALRNRPRPFVTISPERTTRMGEEAFEPSGSLPEQKQPCADVLSLAGQDPPWEKGAIRDICLVACLWHGMRRLYGPRQGRRPGG